MPITVQDRKPVGSSRPGAGVRGHAVAWPLRTRRVPGRWSMCRIKSVRDVPEHCVRYVPGPYRVIRGEGGLKRSVVLISVMKKYAPLNRWLDKPSNPLTATQCKRHPKRQGDEHSGSGLRASWSPNQI